MTLEETWEQCEKMWNWISRRYQYLILFPKHPSVSDLKWQWLQKNYSSSTEECPEALCFFCEYAVIMEERYDFLKGSRMTWSLKDVCRYCPGRKVDPTFDCQDKQKGYHWERNPVQFAAKIRELNRKRKAKKDAAARRKK